MFERAAPPKETPVPLSVAAGQRIVTPGFDPVLGWIGGENARAAQALVFPHWLLEPRPSEVHRICLQSAGSGAAQPTGAEPGGARRVRLRGRGLIPDCIACRGTGCDRYGRGQARRGLVPLGLRHRERLHRRGLALLRKALPGIRGYALDAHRARLRFRGLGRLPRERARKLEGCAWGQLLQDRPPGGEAYLLPFEPGPGEGYADRGGRMGQARASKPLALSRPQHRRAIFGRRRHADRHSGARAFCGDTCSVARPAWATSGAAFLHQRF